MSSAQQMMLAQGKAKAQITFQSAGAFSTAVAAGQLVVAAASGITFHDLLLCHVAVRHASAASITTPSGWTLLDSRTVGATTRLSAIYGKIAIGTEGAQTFVETDDTYAYGRMYRFSRGNTFESATGLIATSSAAAISCADVTSTQTLSLAVNCMFAEVNTTLADALLESGGDYTQPVAAASGAPYVFGIQTSLIGAGSITGGTATLGVAGSNRFTHGVVLNP